MQVELWSIYFPPVPMGIGPAAGTLAKELIHRGHEVTVVTSHPHYPKPDWGTAWKRKSFARDGLRVVELPIYPRRQTALQRAGEEFTYAVKQTGWALRRSDADVIIATLPSVMCLPGAFLQNRLHGKPVVLWLQDVVSRAAEATGLVGGARIGPVIRKLERSAFQRTDQTVVISETFRRQLLDAGVPRAAKISRIYLGSPRAIVPRPPRWAPDNPVVLVIGNIGLTQNLPAFVEAFLASPALRAVNAQLRITGEGVQAEAVRAAVDGERARYLGLLSEEELGRELRDASVGLVSQGSGLGDFNLPSKAVTYMASGLPVVAAVDEDSEIAVIVKESETGLAVSNEDLDVACMRLSELLESGTRLERASRQATAFARANFEPGVMAEQFEQVLIDAAEGR